MKKESFYKLLYFAAASFILLAPALPQVFGVHCPLIRPWQMYKEVGWGRFHIEARSPKTNQWIDLNALNSFTSSFKTEEDVKTCIKEIQKHYPDAKITVKKSTPKGWSHYAFE